MTRRSRRSKRPGRVAHGLLLIDKAKGCSSFDVIRDLRRQTQVKKMGHTGTLDPMATGLMVICVGEGTKLVPYLTADDKTYEAEVTFGISTDSYDAEGEIIAKNTQDELTHLNEERIERALHHFLGPQTQTPPAFSAIKVNGERLYKKARRGEEVEVPTREVIFYTLNLRSFSPQSEGSPAKVRFTVKCSKGTYIRSLASDLGEQLGVYAHLSQLRRITVGEFSLKRAQLVQEITPESLNSSLIPLIDALPALPIITLTEANLIKVKQGRAIKLPETLKHVKFSVCRAQSFSGVLVALLKNEAESLKVLRGFNLPSLPPVEGTASQTTCEET